MNQADRHAAPDAPAHRRGILAMVVGVFAFALSDAGVKWLTDDYSVAQILFLRSLVTLIIVIPVMARRDGASATLRTQRLGAHVVRSLFVIIAVLGGFLSYARLPFADAMAIMMTIPLITAALSVPMLGERVSLRNWAAIGVGFAGALIIVRPGAGMFSSGALFALGASLCFGVFLNQTRRLSVTDSNAAIMFYTTAILTVASGALAAFGWVAPSGADLALFLAVGVFAGLGQYLMVIAFRVAPSALIAPFDYTGLIWAALLGYLVWRDIPGPHVVLGAVVIVASGLYLARGETGKPAAAPTS